MVERNCNPPPPTQVERCSNQYALHTKTDVTTLTSSLYNNSCQIKQYIYDPLSSLQYNKQM